MKPELNSLEKYSLCVIQKIDEYTLVWHTVAHFSPELIYISTRDMNRDWAMTCER